VDLIALRYFMNDRIKPVYHVCEGDNILLTAKIDRSGRYSKKVKSLGIGKSAVETDREHGLYFLGVALKKKNMWAYTYKGWHDIPGNWFELEFETHLRHDKRTEYGILENRLMYKKVNQKGIKDLVVLYE
jgi:hypothetical protein